MSKWQLAHSQHLLSEGGEGLEVLVSQGSVASLHLRSLCQGQAPGLQPSSSRQVLRSVGSGMVSWNT